MPVAMADDSRPRWQSLAALLTGIAAVVTAVTGLVALRRDAPTTPPAVVARAAPPPPSADARPPAAPASLAGQWEDDAGRTFKIVVDAAQIGTFEMEQIKPRKEDSTLWKATVRGRDVTIDVFAMPAGSHEGHMDLELSPDGNRMIGLLKPGGASPDFPPEPIRFRRAG